MQVYNPLPELETTSFSLAPNNPNWRTGNTQTTSPILPKYHCKAER